MPLIQAIILAVIQGLTEFLPISSTAHLILFPRLLHWKEPGLAFDVALHVGTLLAVVLYFLRDWITLIACGFGAHYPAKASAEEVSQHRRLFWYMALGTIPAAVAGFLFHHQIEDKLREFYIIGPTLLTVGLLMWWADSSKNLNRRIEQSNLGDSIFIGIAQAFALVPGVSRSGVTITTGLFRGMTREAATRFSFLLSTPAIAGAAVMEMPKLIHMQEMSGPQLPLSTLALSIVVSGLLGILVIAFFLRYLQVRTLKVFVVYRIVFGMIVLLLAFLHLGTAR